MPYDAFQEGDKWCVYKLDGDKKPTGDSIGCHESEDGAKEQLRALYASDEKAFAPDLIKQVAYATPQFSLWERIKSRKKPGVAIWKQGDTRYMFIVTSNSYRDREREYITTDALKNYVERSWIGDDVCKTDNVLLFWHEDEHVKAIGDIVWCNMQGSFLVEVAKERKTETAKRIWDHIEANPEQQWGASHGFRYEEKVLGADGSATYHHIQKFETSVLPRQNAANQYTFSGVINMSKRDEYLEKIGLPIGSLLKGVSELEKELKKRGVEHKEAANEAEKAIMGNLNAQVDTFIAKLTDNPPAGLKEEFMGALVSAIAVAPADDLATDEDKPVPVEVTTTEETPYNKELAEKQVKLMEKVVELMAANTEKQIEMSDQQKILVEGQKSLAPISELRDEFKKMTDRLGAVEDQIAGRPRQASAAKETVTDPNKVSEEVKEQMATHSSFWGTQVKGQ